MSLKDKDETNNNMVYSLSSNSSNPIN